MNLLHVMPDEKFAAFTIELFRGANGLLNRFVVVSDTNRMVPGARVHHDVHYVDRSYPATRKAGEDLEWCDCLVVHFLNRVSAEVILRAPQGVRIAWSGWGKDYYGQFRGGEARFLGPETRRLAAESSGMHHGLLWRGRKGLSRLREVIQLRAAISRVDLFSAPVEDDFDLVRRELGPLFKARYVQLHYGSVARTFRVGAQDVVGDAILVGNSATWTNNHVEIFQLLAQADLGARRVLVPLNYGDSACRRVVVEKGRAILGERFVPITEWMPLERYNGLVATCSAVVMGHQRQQALGNLGAALWRGCRVFMEERSTTCQFLRREGVVVSGMCELASKWADLGTANSSQKERTREILTRIWGDSFVFGGPLRLQKAVMALR